MPRSCIAPDGEPLTCAEARLLQLVCAGLSDREIGRLIHRSPHTVKHQIERLRDRVGARNRIQLAAWGGILVTDLSLATPG